MTRKGVTYDDAQPLDCLPVLLDGIIQVLSYRACLPLRRIPTSPLYAPSMGFSVPRRAAPLDQCANYRILARLCTLTTPAGVRQKPRLDTEYMGRSPLEARNEAERKASLRAWFYSPAQPTGKPGRNFPPWKCIQIESTHKAKAVVQRETLRRSTR
jgi:hypothetical protein